MSIQDKIQNAKPSTWLTDGLPKWKVKLIIWWAKFKIRKVRNWNDKRRSN